MKYFNLTKKIAALAIGAVLFSSCDKTETVDEINSKGTTTVKILGGGDPTVKLWSIDFVPTPQSLVAVDVRRDVPNNAELNKEMTVVVKDDLAAVTALDPTLIPLPTAFYTIGAGTPKVGGAGGTYTLTFKPGEFAKEIIITVPDATVLSTSDTYGLAFTITSITGDGKISDSKTIIYKIGAKNIYDGVYTITGTCVDASGLYQGIYYTNYADYEPTYTKRTYEASTVGATTVLTYDLSFDYPNYLVENITSLGLANTGIQPKLTFNGASNTVSSIINNANAAVITVNSGSKYNPGDKSIDLDWTLGRWRVKEHWTYLRAR